MKLTLEDGDQILEFDLMGNTIIKIDGKPIWTSDTLDDIDSNLDDFLKDLYSNKTTQFEF